MRKTVFAKENYRRPFLAVAGVIIKKIKGKDYVLLGKRKGKVGGSGYYCLPGGHIKKGEMIEEALIREVKEETGLDVALGKFLWIEENFEVIHHLILYYQAKLLNPRDNPKNLEPEKCEGWHWFPLINPPELLWGTLGKFLNEHYRKKRIENFGKASLDYVGVGVGGVILNEKNEVLLQLRGPKAKNEVGFWKLPGGQIEWGETAAEALGREIREELGVEVEIGKQIYCLDDILIKEGQHWLVPFYLCRIKRGKPRNKEPGKIEKIRWFPLSRLPKKLAFGTGEIMEILKKE